MDKTQKKPEGLEEHALLADEETEEAAGGFVESTRWYKEAFAGDFQSPVGGDPMYKDD